jgi:hypothetical protein
MAVVEYAQVTDKLMIEPAMNRRDLFLSYRGANKGTVRDLAGDIEAESFKGKNLQLGVMSGPQKGSRTDIPSSEDLGSASNRRWSPQSRPRCPLHRGPAAEQAEPHGRIANEGLSVCGGQLLEVPGVETRKALR